MACQLVLDDYLIWLVVSNIFYFPFHIWDVILPIDELHHFSSWLLHHQPGETLTPPLGTDPFVRRSNWLRWYIRSLPRCCRPFKKAQTRHDWCEGELGTGQPPRKKGDPCQCIWSIWFYHVLSETSYAAIHYSKSVA